MNPGRPELKIGSIVYMHDRFKKPGFKLKCSCSRPIVQGDLVRYRPWPHTKLFESGLVGLAVSSVYDHRSNDLQVIDILWGGERSPAWTEPDVLGLSITWDFVDEIECINESIN